jgi:hypothetical protein
MKRLSFLAILFGLGSIAKAQPDTYQYKNGYCPICGTLAPVYVRNRSMRIVPCVNPTILSRVCTEPGAPTGSPTQTVVCAKCKVLFVQEAQKIES